MRWKEPEVQRAGNVLRRRWSGHCGSWCSRHGGLWCRPRGGPLVPSRRRGLWRSGRIRTPASVPGLSPRGSPRFTPLAPRRRRGSSVCRTSGCVGCRMQPWVRRSAGPPRPAVEGRRVSYFWLRRVSDATVGTTFGGECCRPRAPTAQRRCPPLTSARGCPPAVVLVSAGGRSTAQKVAECRTSAGFGCRMEPEVRRSAWAAKIAAHPHPSPRRKYRRNLSSGLSGGAVSGTAGRLTTLFHMLHRPGGDWSRQRMSSEEKRAEEADDDLVNHPSEKKSSADNSQRVYALAA